MTVVDRTARTGIANTAGNVAHQETADWNCIAADLLRSPAGHLFVGPALAITDSLDIIEDMAPFTEIDAFQKFEKIVKFRRRFIHDEWTRGFLETVAELSEGRSIQLEKGRQLWRAQRGCIVGDICVKSPDGEIEIRTPQYTPYPPDRMKPTREVATNGRANPLQIPFLYLATDAKTAKAEMRPWLGCRLSLGLFELTKRCRVVDLSATSTRSPRALRVLTTADVEDRVWWDIACAFSKPVDPEDGALDYIPTQILAETFREAGFHGVQYRSLMNPGGMTLALFDLDSAEMIDSGLYLTTNISYDDEEIGGPYFTGSH